MNKSVSYLKILYVALLACCLPLQAAQPPAKSAREKQISYAPAALKPALEEQLKRQQAEDAKKTAEQLAEEKKAREDKEAKARDEQKKYAPKGLQELLKSQKLPPTKQ